MPSSSSSSRPLTVRLHRGSRPRGSVKEQSQQRQDVMTSDVAVTDLTNVHSSSSSAAAAAADQGPPSDLSNFDLPDYHTNVVPPPPSLPPPAPPFISGSGKLLPGTSVGHPGTGAGDPGSSPVTNIPLSPPGPAPVLRPSHAGANKSTAGSGDKSAATNGSAVIDMASIEAVRQRLKKPSRTEVSVMGEFMCYMFSPTYCKFFVLCIQSSDKTSDKDGDACARTSW